MDHEALTLLLRRAEETHSDALVVRHGGQLLGVWHFGREPRPIQTMSCTKSVVGLAVGALLDDGALASIDQPLCELYPEWRQGRKRAITIRHLLNHTSGLQNELDASTEIEPSPDVIQLALAAELSDEPGARFIYNNKAVNLLAGVVRRVSGQRLDEYLRDRLFQPLDITEFNWMQDPAGTPYAMAGLALRAEDLATIGQLMLNKGWWDGRCVISEGWVDASFAQGQPYNDRCGLLWWRIPAYEHFIVDDGRLADLAAAGVSAPLLEQLRPLVNIRFESRFAYQQALAEVLGPEWVMRIVEEVERKGLQLSRRTAGPIVGYETNGWLGQYLVVVPAEQLVAVRLVRDTPTYNPATDGFGDFAERVLTLSRSWDRPDDDRSVGVG